MKWIVYLLLATNLGLFIWKIRDHQQLQVAAPAVMVQDNQVNRLPLLSEMSSDAVRAREPETLPASGDTKVASTSSNTSDGTKAENTAVTHHQCYTVGPLQDPQSTVKVNDWLNERQASFAIREDQRRETARYWVYFPPLESREAASNRVEVMRGAGIDDLIIIPRGDMTNAISLGVYTRKTSVDRRLAQLQAKGYQPSVVPRYRTVKATWVDVLMTEFEDEMDAFLAAFPALGVNRTNCSSELIAGKPKSSYNPPRPARQYQYSGNDAPVDDSSSATEVKDIQ